MFQSFFYNKNQATPHLFNTNHMFETPFVLLLNGVTTPPCPLTTYSPYHPRVVLANYRRFLGLFRELSVSGNDAGFGGVTQLEARTHHPRFRGDCLHGEIGWTGWLSSLAPRLFFFLWLNYIYIYIYFFFFKACFLMFSLLLCMWTFIFLKI